VKEKISRWGDPEAQSEEKGKGRGGGEPAYLGLGKKGFASFTIFKKGRDGGVT